MVSPPIPQCLPASGAPNLKRHSPIKAIVGAIVTGPTNLRSFPTMPV